MTDTPTTRWPTLPDGRMLVLRTCDAEMRSEHTPAFVWPTSGPVEAPVGYVGEDGIEPNSTYRCSASGALEAVRP